MDEGFAVIGSSDYPKRDDTKHVDDTKSTNRSKPLNERKPHLLVLKERPPPSPEADDLSIPAPIGLQFQIVRGTETLVKICEYAFIDVCVLAPDKVGSQPATEVLEY
jgi:hypothetical protein